MRLGNVIHGGQPRAVVSDGDSLYLLLAPDARPFASTDELIASGIGLRSLERQVLSREDGLLPAVTRPEKIVCVGRNYLAHVEQEGAEVPPAPCLFAKFPSSLAAHGAVVHPPQGAMQLDYEGELAVVIGREARNVPAEQALDYVFGYCNANDVSARDLQFRTPQWLSGKAPDGFCPLGPWLVTADEIQDPQHLDIRVWRGDKVVQESNTSRMIYPVRQLIAYISHLVTLRPGDVILTGTPEGTEYGKESPNWLRAGETVAVEVGGLGRLESVIGEAI